MTLLTKIKEITLVDWIFILLGVASLIVSILAYIHANDAITQVNNLYTSGNNLVSNTGDSSFVLATIGQ
ncbi:MAG TPA: hypothetical protein VHA12_00830 [Candidatus Nanoarchaeia archaeon]|nr:hypothetical protein [Candidatus Nanoarchaeia archaeon]